MIRCLQDAPGPVWQLGAGPAPHPAAFHQLCGGDGSPPTYRSHRLHLHFSRASLRRLNIHSLPGRCFFGAADTETQLNYYESTRAENAKEKCSTLHSTRYPTTCRPSVPPSAVCLSATFGAAVLDCTLHLAIW